EALAREDAVDGFGETRVEVVLELGDRARLDADHVFGPREALGDGRGITGLHFGDPHAVGGARDAVDGARAHVKKLERARESRKRIQHSQPTRQRAFGASVGRAITARPNPGASLEALFRALRPPPEPAPSTRS